LSRILRQLLAAGVGAGNLRRIEEWKTALWKIVCKGSSVGQRLAQTGFSTNEMRGTGAITESTYWRFWPKTVLLPSPRSCGISHVARFAWTALCWNVAVVLWGAYVRATGSGAGCGNRWPLCDGDVVGARAQAQTIVEFTHRMTSAISLLMAIGLVVWSWRVTKRGDWVRYSALLVVALLANEALLGAALVLLKHVADDHSVGRILFLCLHFGNTLLLLAALALTAVWLSNGSRSFTLTGKWREVSSIGLGLLATMATGITGAVAALADTLFPSTSLRSSLMKDFGSVTPALLHCRLFHPAEALISACSVLWIVLGSFARRHRFSRSAIALIISILLQVAVGIANVFFLAPVWLQIAHLFLADVLWVLLVLVLADLILDRTSSSEVNVLPSFVKEGQET